MTMVCLAVGLGLSAPLWAEVSCACVCRISMMQLFAASSGVSRRMWQLTTRSMACIEHAVGFHVWWDALACRAGLAAYSCCLVLPCILRCGPRTAVLGGCATSVIARVYFNSYTGSKHRRLSAARTRPSLATSPKLGYRTSDRSVDSRCA
jgi:hypothetical protein